MSRAVRGAGARGGRAAVWNRAAVADRSRAMNRRRRGPRFAPVRGPAGFGAVPVEPGTADAARPRASDPGPRPRRIVPGAPRGSVYTTTSVRGSVALRRADRSRLERGPPSGERISIFKYLAFPCPRAATGSCLPILEGKIQRNCGLRLSSVASRCRERADFFSSTVRTLARLAIAWSAWWWPCGQMSIK